MLSRSGEFVELSERLVISPAAGRVHLPKGADGPGAGEFVLEDESLARISCGDGTKHVQTRFRGWLMGYLVLDGQPIGAGDAVAWLRGV